MNKVWEQCLNCMYTISDFLRTVKKMFLISFIYNAITLIILFIISASDLQENVLILVFSILSFYISWGISSTIMMAQTMARPLPLIDNKYFLKPGRYINIGNLFYWELRTSPVNDYYFIAFILSIIYGIVFICIFIFQKQILSLCFLNMIFSFEISIFHECNRFREEYMENIKKAKIIFMNCKGDSKVLEANESYYIYQVSKSIEDEWYKELENEMNFPFN